MNDANHLRIDGFTPEERTKVLAWARRMRPEAKVQLSDLFEAEAA